MKLTILISILLFFISTTVTDGEASNETSEKKTVDVILEKVEGHYIRSQYSEAFLSYQHAYEVAQ